MTKERELSIISSILTKPHQHFHTHQHQLLFCECLSFSLNTNLLEAGIIKLFLSNTENPKECVEKTGSVA